MTRWAAFAGVTVAVLAILLVLARATRTAMAAPPAPRWLDSLSDGADHLDVAHASRPPERRPSASALLANVVVSQAVFAGLLVAGAWYAEVPPAALGVEGPLAPQVAVGAAVGVALAAANAAAGAAADAAGLDPSRELRELLAPDSPAGWALLLGVALPAIAVFEELLFRGALIGGFAAGFGVSPWLLAVLSSGAFALGHGAQGRLGVVVTGLLGFGLAAAFVLTGSLVAVVVAHYLVNATEFVLREA